MKDQKLNSKNNIARRSIVLAIATLISLVAHAVDSFDPTSNLLTMDSVTTGGATYRNVAVTVGSYDLIGVAGGSPAADTFDPASNVLLLGAVAFQGATYNNVSIKINTYTLRSVGGTPTAGTLPVPNYTGEMAGYLTALNNYRTQCGIPALSQNTALDVAAGNITQAQWPVTQVTLATNAGYAVPNTVGGVSSQYFSNSVNTTTVGQLELQIALMNYTGMLNLLRPYTEVGLVPTVYQAGSINQRVAQVLLGNPVQRNTGVVTFPCANTTDVAPYTTTLEGKSLYQSWALGAISTDYTPSPNGTQGTPIAVFANPGETLVITAATVTLRGGAGVPVSVVTGSLRTKYDYEGVVWPQQNLLANSAYDVVIIGTVNGAGFSKNFTFRTGAQIPLNLP